MLGMLWLVRHTLVKHVKASCWTGMVKAKGVFWDAAAMQLLQQRG